LLEKEKIFSALAKDERIYHPALVGAISALRINALGLGKGLKILCSDEEKPSRFVRTEPFGVRKWHRVRRNADKMLAVMLHYVPGTAEIL
jgi:hypothetical protein